MIKAILFDYDGTLSKRKKAAYDMYRHCISCMRKDLDPSGIEFEGIVQFCMSADQNGLVPKPYVWQRVKERYIPELDVDAWTKYWSMHFNDFQTAEEGAYEVLDELRKYYKTGILSNGSYESQLAKIRSLGMDEHVDEVVISGMYVISKPDPRIFEIAAGKLGVSCQETAFVGDTFFTDITGAKQAGMFPVWFTSAETVSDSDVTRVKDFREVLNLFLEMKERGL